MTPQPDGVVVHSQAVDVTARCVVTCAGLQCDRVTAMSGQKLDAKSVPFRGEYYALKPAHTICAATSLPGARSQVPVFWRHFTRMIRGALNCGPNAVLAFAREGYRKSDINIADLAETLTYPGFLRMAFRHWRMGMGELWRSYSKRAFVRALQRLLPAIRADDLEAIPRGVRAQLVSRDGSMVDGHRHPRQPNACSTSATRLARGHGVSQYQPSGLSRARGPPGHDRRKSPCPSPTVAPIHRALARLHDARFSSRLSSHTACCVARNGIWYAADRRPVGQGSRSEAPSRKTLPALRSRTKPSRRPQEPFCSQAVPASPAGRRGQVLPQSGGSSTAASAAQPFRRSTTTSIGSCCHINPASSSCSAAATTWPSLPHP